jgi:hypothetical protein
VTKKLGEEVPTGPWFQGAVSCDGRGVICAASDVRSSDVGSDTEVTMRTVHKGSNHPVHKSGAVAAAEEREQSSSTRIREINDTLRTALPPRNLHITSGVKALPASLRAKALALVRAYDKFTIETDPFNEHEFGAFEIQGHHFCWKIEAFDKELRYGSEDPSDPEKTTRILVLMLAR